MRIVTAVPPGRIRDDTIGGDERFGHRRSTPRGPMASMDRMTSTNGMNDINGTTSEGHEARMTNVAREVAPRRVPSCAGVVAWGCLVAVAVVGRLWQPSWNGEPLWNVTPLAAVALAAGTLFPNVAVAASVPLTALALTNLALPGYGDLAMAAVVYAAFAWPVLLGGVLRRAAGRGFVSRWATRAGGSLASSLVFFVTTNLACWGLSDGLYPRTSAGLSACFTAALPFYRWMPVGDLVWTGVVFGAMALASRARVSLTAAETA